MREKINGIYIIDILFCIDVKQKEIIFLFFYFLKRFIKFNLIFVVFVERIHILIFYFVCKKKSQREFMIFHIVLLRKKKIHNFDFVEKEFIIFIFQYFCCEKSQRKLLF
jgi:hypothetical protein